MKNKQKIFNTIAIVLLSASGVVRAIDLSYDPDLDTPTYTEFESTTKEQPVKTLTDKKRSTPTDEGWSVKVPVISSDKTPYITDEREAVRISEEQRWLNGTGGNEKKYDEDPLNSDNYRITVEAEYSF